MKNSLIWLFVAVTNFEFLVGLQTTQFWFQPLSTHFLLKIGIHITWDLAMFSLAGRLHINLKTITSLV